MLQTRRAICLLLLLTSIAAENGIRVKRGGLLFPPASGMGMFLALAIPVDLPQYELSLSYNFEANYLLPSNATELELGPQVTQIRYARSLTRTRVYDMIEDRLHNSGLEGRSCLLRTICETSASPVQGHNGLLGDLIHLIFTPSSSADEDLPKEYVEAEKTGEEGGREACLKTYDLCPFDLYEHVSMWEEE